MAHKGKGKGKRKAARSPAQKAATKRMLEANRSKRQNPAPARAAGKQVVVVNPRRPRARHPSAASVHSAAMTLASAPVRRRGKRRKRRNPDQSLAYQGFSFLAAGAGGWLVGALADFAIPATFMESHPGAIRLVEGGVGVLGGVTLAFLAKEPAAGAGFALGMLSGPVYGQISAMRAATPATPAKDKAVKGVGGLAGLLSGAPQFGAVAETAVAWSPGSAPTV